MINSTDIFQQREEGLFERDFLLTWEKSIDDLKKVIEIAEKLMDMRKRNISPKIFDSGLAISLFRDQSTRTRFSFASASNLLGLEIADLDEKKSQISHGETVRETANMISFLAEIVGIRDDIFLGEGDEYMREFGKSLSDGFENGILPSRPGIINLQSDIDHPTQTLADLAHLKNHFGSFENLRGKKIAMTWAYSPSYGKPLSVPQGIIGLLSRLGMDVVLAYPKGYELIPELEEMAEKFSRLSGGKFSKTDSMEEAFSNADIVYPKSWAPFNVMEKRTKLLKTNDRQKLEELEALCLEKNRDHLDWECNKKIMNITKQGNALYMHCLPADITDISCEHGEVSADVFEKARLDTYREAGFKPYVIAAMILSNRLKDPMALLKDIEKQGPLRILGE